MSAPEQKNPERVFMHDLATPMAVALGMLDLMIDDSTSGVTVLPEAAFKRAEKAQAALLKMQEMMKERRSTILAADAAKASQP